VVASLPFAPEIVLPTIDHLVHHLKLKVGNPYGFKATFNPTYPEKSGRPNGWVSPWHYGINQGPIVPMIENYWTGLVWRLMRAVLHRHRPTPSGLRRRLAMTRGQPCIGRSLATDLKRSDRTLSASRYVRDTGPGRRVRRIWV